MSTYRHFLPVIAGVINTFPSNTKPISAGSSSITFLFIVVMQCIKNMIYLLFSVDMHGTEKGWMKYRENSSWSNYEAVGNSIHSSISGNSTTLGSLQKACGKYVEIILITLKTLSMLWGTWLQTCFSDWFPLDPVNDFWWTISNWEVCLCHILNVFLNSQRFICLQIIVLEWFFCSLLGLHDAVCLFRKSRGI